MLRTLLAFVLMVIVTGCSSDPPRMADPTEFTGKAMLGDGKPVAEVRLNLLPTKQGQSMGTANTGADGTFTVKLIPGEYTYTFEPASKPAAFKAVPEAYHTAKAEHKITATPGQPIEIKLAK